MNSKIKIVLAIVALSIFTFLMMFYVMDAPLKKAVFVPAFAGTAMIVFDVLLIKKKKA